MKPTTAPTTSIGYAFVDADADYYESRDCFTRHMERAHAEKAVRVVRGDDGRERIIIGDEKFTYLTPLFDDARLPRRVRAS